jgi:hypothetical protein
MLLLSVDRVLPNQTNLAIGLAVETGARPEIKLPVNSPLRTFEDADTSTFDEFDPTALSQQSSQPSKNPIPHVKCGPMVRLTLFLEPPVLFEWSVPNGT